MKSSRKYWNECLDLNTTDLYSKFPKEKSAQELIWFYVPPQKKFWASSIEYSQDLSSVQKYWIQIVLPIFFSLDKQCGKDHLTIKNISKTFFRYIVFIEVFFKVGNKMEFEKIVF